MDEDIKVAISIPFPTNRAAQIAYDVLRIDVEPKRSQVKKTLSLENNILNVEFVAEAAKNIRVATTSFFEALILCTETQIEFGPPVSEQYDH